MHHLKNENREVSENKKALASIMETANSVVVILAVCIMPLEFQFENEYGSELTDLFTEKTTSEIISNWIFQ